MTPRSHFTDASVPNAPERSTGAAGARAPDRPTGAVDVTGSAGSTGSTGATGSAGATGQSPRADLAGTGETPISATKEQAGPAKVVVLLQDLFFGGTQRHALELASRLSRERFRVEVWTLIGGDDFLPLAGQYGLATRRLSSGKTVGPAALLGLWRALRADPPDLLLPLTVVPNIWGRILGRLAGVRAIIGNCRGARDAPGQHEWLLKSLADHHLCNAEALRGQLTRTYGLPPERVTTIHNGVNTDYYAPPTEAPSGPPVILHLARMDSVKDHPTLIAAFERLAASQAEPELWLVGDGPERDKVARRIGQSPFSQRIRLMPGAADVRPLYARAALLVLSSRHEGLPNVVLEAMASGLPVVATDVGGLAEIVKDGLTGRLVPAGDPERLALALAEVLGRPERRAAMGAAARRRAVAGFSMEAMVKAHEAALARVLTRKGPKGGRP